MTILIKQLTIEGEEEKGISRWFDTHPNRNECNVQINERMVVVTRKEWKEGKRNVTEVEIV